MSARVCAGAAVVLATLPLGAAQAALITPWLLWLMPLLVLVASLCSPLLVAVGTVMALPEPFKAVAQAADAWAGA